MLECVGHLGQARVRRHQRPARIDAGAAAGRHRLRYAARRSEVGRRSQPDHVFPLYANRDAAHSAGFGRQLRCVSYFQGSVAGLAVGADVTLHGLKIGEVTELGLASTPRSTASSCRCITRSRPTASATSRPAHRPCAAGRRRRDGQTRASAPPCTPSLLTGTKVVAIEADPRRAAGRDRHATAMTSSCRRAKSAASTASPPRPPSC